MRDEGLPAELMCSRLASSRQRPGAVLAPVCALHLPADTAVYSAHEGVATFGNLYPADIAFSNVLWFQIVSQNILVMLSCTFVHIKGSSSIE